ncbi:hypothetical protein PRZ48_002386 [Zasmidium cellare]|uniref:Alcohol dehydrogenase n=1 Tax=Zasmidium cellare TaxID=395010 RepID=A0ABR0F3V6_ZASCE|nr:hypothetical protein PRZ48_002386 [Zasmidium cellare]
MPNLTTALNATMLAVRFHGTPFSVQVDTIPIPTLSAPTDAVVRLTTAAICGSDLHNYRGTAPSADGEVPYVLGHEGVGYVHEVGEAVGSLSVGDPVVIPFNTPEGHLHTDLTRSLYASYGQGGELGGTQAEYIRIPLADEALIPVPSFITTDPATNETISLENDYVMVSDIFATGWAALDYAGFHAGDTVAVFGAGPVGLMAAYSAIIRGAAKVYSIDYVSHRLELAESIGATPINFRDSDPVDQILAREPNGVARSVDAVGYEQLNTNLTLQSDVILHNMLRVTSPGGGLGTVGVYNPRTNSSTSAPRADTIQEPLSFDMSSFFGSALKWQAGASDPIALAPWLVSLVSSGRARPGFIVEEEVGIEEAVEAYARFERRGVSKVVIKF